MDTKQLDLNDETTKCLGQLKTESRDNKRKRRSRQYKGRSNKIMGILAPLLKPRFPLCNASLVTG